MTRGGILQPLFYDPAKHIYRMMRNKKYFALMRLESRLRDVPRFRPCEVRAHAWTLRLPDSASFLSSYSDIFTEEIYAFKAAVPQPRILDLGANIGLGTLFFKSLYPAARITAYEADPGIFEYLLGNVHGNGFSDAELVNMAVWHEEAVLKFASEGADAGRVGHAGIAGSREIEVHAVGIRDILDRETRIDFLKMDIEGAENTVIPAMAPQLAKIENLFIEYHSAVGEKQRLHEIIGLVSKSGFRVHIHESPATRARSPFVERVDNCGFDLQLNIYCWRDRH